MSIVFGPQPGESGLEEVQVDGFDLRVKPGSYKRSAAPRFGQKISTGDLRYQDFNPYESAASFSSLEDGYGLRRFSDLSATQSAQLAQNFYAESVNVDCRLPGICISPYPTPIGFPTPTRDSLTILWMGEFTPSAGTLSGSTFMTIITKGGSSGNTVIDVWYLSAIGTITYTGQLVSLGAGTITLPAKLPVIVSGGQCIVGFGSQNVALYFTALDSGTFAADNVKDTATNNLYAWAVTSDGSAVYLAGGTATTSNNTVTSASTAATNPAQSFATSTNAVTCGSNFNPITGLAPGGGSVLLWVAKWNELGMIDNSSIYHVVMPFQTRQSTNGAGLCWWLSGINGEGATGPLILVFPQSDSLWTYTPGTASVTCLTANGKPGFRPITATGIITAIQGSPHYLYYALKNQSSGDTFIIANDGISGANHTWRYQGPYNCNAMAITNLYSTAPIMYLEQSTTVANGASLAYITFPIAGDWPPGDPTQLYENSQFYASSNYLLMSDIDLGFPDEDKIPIYIRMTGDNLTGSTQIIVDYALDGSSTYTRLGIFQFSPQQDLPFTSYTAFKRISIKLTFVTTGAGGGSLQTPILNAISLRCSINPKQYTIWSFDCVLPSGTTNEMTEQTYNANEVITTLWTDYKAGVPVTYIDRWNYQWNVRILDFSETETFDEDLRTPESSLSMTLLEVNGDPQFAWDSPVTFWDDVRMVWG